MARKPKAWPPVYAPEPGADPRGLSALLIVLVEWMRVRGLSEFTIHRRVHTLRFFFAWCDQRGVTRPDEVSKPILERYQRFLFRYRSADGEPLSFRSQHVYLTAIRAYFGFLARKNYLPGNPASDLDMPKCGRQLPRNVLTVPEVERIMNAPNIADPLGLRDRVILETLYSTGIRRMELIKLLIYDLTIDHRTLMIREGKGKMNRLIPIGERALAWIRKYLDDIRPSFVIEPDEGILFLKATGEPITPSALTHIVSKYVREADIGKSGYCHMFRHTMATLMLEGGADVRYIQQMLGHAKLETTSLYIHVSIRKLQEVCRHTHPGANLKSDREEEKTKERGIAPDPAGRGRQPGP